MKTKNMNPNDIKRRKVCTSQSEEVFLNKMGNPDNRKEMTYIFTA